jgi:hypothetical protein
MKFGVKCQNKWNKEIKEGEKERREERERFE